MEYEANNTADNSDDKKKIRHAESRAIKQLKRGPNLALLRTT